MASFCSHCCIRIRRARHWHAPKKKRDGRSTCQLIARLVASCRQALLPPSLVYVYLLVWCCAYVHVYVHVPMTVAGVVDIFVTLKSGRFFFYAVCTREPRARARHGDARSICLTCENAAVRCTFLYSFFFSRQVR